MILLRCLVLSAVLLSVAQAGEPTAAGRAAASSPQSGRTTQLRDPRVRPGGAEKTGNLGLTARNAKFANFGRYLQTMVEAVQAEWDTLRTKYKIHPPAGTYVTVPFTLNSSGAIVRFDEIDTTTDREGIHAAVSAIANRAPFGAWSEDMKRMLNSEEQLRLTFYYP